jgi:hypothetical protein
MEDNQSSAARFKVNIPSGIVGAIGDSSQVIQHIGDVYNIYPAVEGGPRITASLKERLHRLLERHALFGGRESELRSLQNFLTDKASGYLFVTGRPGFGKTALLANWVKGLEQTKQNVCYHFISRLDGIADEDFTFRNLCQQLTARHDLRGALPASAAEMRSLYPELLSIPRPEGEKLVVVLDGLDESVGWVAGPDLFPRHLPEGVFVVFSAREIAGQDWLAMLELSSTEVRLLILERLGLAEIAHLLKAAGNGAARWGDDRAFLATMHDKSKGDPFYLHYLVEDIRDVPIVSLKQLEQQPRGLKKYLDKWWLEVSAAASEQAVRDLLGYLLVAKGPLTRHDLIDITDLDALDGWVFERTIQQVRRYVVGTEEEGYSLSHSRFQDYVMEEHIRERDQHSYRQRLIDYCSRWAEHQSKYALRHYATHLLGAKRVNELFGLARDKVFHTLQRDLLPDEPNLPLKTLQIALTTAAGLDDARAMAEFLLEHAERLQQTTAGESPLDAMRGCNLYRAWEIASMHDVEISTLWHLLLSWELQESGASADAQATLERILEKGSARLSGWKSDDFISLFASAYRVSADLYVTLFKQLLEQDYYFDLCVNLVAQRQFSGALLTAQAIEDPWTRADALIRIAGAQRDGLAGLLDNAKQIENKGASAWAVGMIAEALAKSGRVELAERAFVDALNAAKQSEDEEARSIVLGAIAGARARLGQKEEALAIYKKAMEVAREIEDEVARVAALAKLAAVPAQAGAFDLALSTTRGMEDAATQADMFKDIALIQYNANQVEAARDSLINGLQAVRQVEDVENQATLLDGIVLAQAEIGDFSGAIQSAQELEDERNQAETLSKIAGLLARAGQFDIARKTAQGISVQTEKVNALLQVAVAQANSGNAEAAHASFLAARSEAEQFVKAAEAKSQGGEWEDWYAAQLVVGQVAVAEAQAGEISSAWETARKITDKEERAKTLAKIAATAAAMGKNNMARTSYALALQTEEEYEAKWRRIDSSRIRAEVLSDIAATQLRENDLTAALETAKSIGDEDKRVDALGAVAVAQAKASQIEAAQATFTVALEVAQTAKDEWVPSKRSGKLWRWIGLSRVTIFPSLRTRADMYTRIANAQLEAGQAQAARTTLDQAYAASSALQSKSDRAWMLARMVKVQADAGSIQDALDHVQNPDFITDNQPRSWAFGMIAAAQTESGHKDAAQRTLDNMIHISERLTDKEERDNWLAQIVINQTAANEFRAAFETVQRIDSQKEQARALGEIAKAQAELGDFDKALKTVLTIHDLITMQVIEEEGLEELDLALLEIVKAQIKAGQFEAARHTATEIPMTNTDAIGEIAETLVKAGHNEDARAILADTIQAFDTLDDDEEREGLLRDVAQAQARIGEFNEAIRIAQGITDESFRAEALCKIAVAQAKSGFVERAVELTAAILTDRKEKLVAITDALAETGDKQYFKGLLVPSAYYSDVAYKMCGLLAHVYPDQAGSVAKVINGYS